VARVTVLVRPLEPTDDAEAAGALVQAAYLGLPGYPHDPEYDAHLGDVATRAAHATVVVAVEGDRVVGCLTFVTDAASEHSDHDDADAVSFRYFGVDPAAQGRGIGEAMVQWCIDEARRLGRARIRIHTLTAMTGAQRLYERMGFVRDPGSDADWDGIIGLAYVFHT
jgi:GNAT superfamily N-acetyltransferase